MKKSTLKRITAFLLAVLITASNVLTAFAADGWTPAHNAIVIGFPGYIEYTFSASTTSALETQKAIATGLSLELTYTQKKGAYGTTLYYDKFWTMNHSASSKDVSLKDGTQLTIDFSKMACQYAPCIADHTSDAGKGDIAFASQIFVPSINNIYIPSNNTSIQQWPDHVVKGGYADDWQKKFVTLLQALTLTMHTGSDSECKDDTSGTAYSMVAYMTARGIEDGYIKCADASADWNALTTHGDWAMIKKWFNPDGIGSNTVWNELNSTGKDYFILCWEYASFMSYFDYDVKDKKVIVKLPTVDSAEGGMYTRTCDYSTFHDLAKKHFQEISASGSSSITVSNDGSKITISSSSPLDDAALSGVSLTYGGSEKNLVPAYLVGVKMVLRRNDGTPAVAGQTRFLAGMAELSDISVGTDSSSGHGGGEASGSEYPDLDRFEYSDAFQADYNIRVKKYDSETGQPLADSWFDITETLNEDSIDGCLTDGSNYDEVEITDDCDQGPHVTNENGELTYSSNGDVAHKDVRTYSYHKGYCQGHPAKEDYYPEEPEAEDEEAHAQWEAACEAVDAKYEEELAICRDTLGGDENGTNGFFCFGEADTDGSLAKAAFEANRDECYEAFIAITYEYTVEEVTARQGYILHGNHTDDVPIETDTVYSSQYLSSNGGSLIASAAPSGSTSIIRDDRLNLLADAKIKDTANHILSFGAITAFAAESEESAAVITESQNTQSEKESSSAAEISAETTSEKKPSSAEDAMEEKGSDETLAEDTLSADPSEMKADENPEKSEDIMPEDSATKEKPSEISENEEISDTEEPAAESSEENQSKTAEENKDEKSTGAPESIKAEEESDKVLPEEEEDEWDYLDDGYETPYDEELKELQKLKKNIRSRSEGRDDEDCDIATPSIATPSGTSGDVASEEEISLLEAILIELRDLWLSFWGLVETVSEDVDAVLSDVGTDMVEMLKMPLMLLGMSVPSGNSNSYYTAYAGWKTSDIAQKDKGETELIDHSFIVFDHRTEGEVHFNKKDLDLAEKENTDYDSYGDSNADGTLEGAVYGLFAEEDIVHPDGHTGVVYKKGDLVAIATTDRNGDASFEVFTEAPGVTWDYSAGTLKATGTASTLNMHRSASSPQAQLGTKDYEGTQNPSPIGASDATYYEKKSSNQAGSYPILNNEDNNGNCWIGRPLITTTTGTHYYIRELTRSEGYELSVSGKSNELTNGKGSENGGTSTQEVSVSATSVTTGISIPTAAQVTVTGKSVAGDVLIKVTNAEKGASAALSVTRTETDTNVIEAIPYTETEYSYPSAGTPVILSNQRVEAVLGETKHLTSGDYTVTQVTDPEPQNRTVTFKEPYIHTIPASLTGYATRAAFVAEYNTQLSVKGYTEPDANAPWLAVELTGANSVAWSACIVNAIMDNGLLYANRMRVSLSGTTAIISYDVYNTAAGTFFDAFEDTSTGKLYVRYTTDQSYFVYLPLDKDDTTKVVSYTTSSGHVKTATLKGLSISASGTKPSPIVTTVAEIPPKTYWTYDGSMKKFDASSGGDIESKTVTKSIGPTDPEWGDPAYRNAAYKGWKYVSGSKTVEDVTPLTSTYDAASKTYYITIPKSAFTAGDPLTLKLYDSGSYTYSPSTQNLFTYVPSAQDKDSYVVSFTLQDTYDGTESPVMYATATIPKAGGAYDQDTVENPFQVFERPIRQSVKLSKDIALNADIDSDGTGDSYRNNTYDLTEATALTNFRFKVYLKSNLERLYRDESGNITWLDRNGNVITPVYNTDGTVSWKYASAYDGKTFDYPETDIKTAAGSIRSVNVMPLYTQVAHNTSSLTTSKRANNLWNTYLTPQGGATYNVALLKSLTTNERSSEDGNAITANTNMFSYNGTCLDTESSNRINDYAKSNTGYTRILEMGISDIEDGTGLITDVQSYDYEKFFDAIAVANGDKWDDAAPTYTSWKPIGNRANRSTEQIDNAKRSDRVRQFAIDYYLKDEVAKLVNTAEGSSGMENDAIITAIDNKYQNQIYDKALNEAIKKAEKYLAPFFKYDLDAIYAIDWDNAEDGGKDSDVHTLSLDSLSGDKSSASSAYLPYGVYVINEEQPRYSGSSYAYNDVLNRQYKTDKPKEIKIPSLYEEGEPGDTGENYDSHYTYHYGTDLKEMSKSSNYLIRFGEEWSDDSDSAVIQSKWVIRAHSDSGDFEVYKFGLDTDRINSNTGKAIASNSGSYFYYGFKCMQDSYEPFKDYYDLAHRGKSLFVSDTISITETEGGNSGAKYFITDKSINTSVTANGSSYKSAELAKRLYYGSISEDKGSASIISHTGTVTDDNKSGMVFKTVSSMTGSLTAYDGEYAQMLVPWSVLEGASLSPAFTGYAEKNVRNELYSAKLRIEKLDSETHENILHDGAAFAIYKAERSSTSGTVMYYTADTSITGSKEFIESYCKKDTAMPVDPENPSGQYKGTVAAGTPVCHEADKVILGDRFGNQVSEFKAYSTIIDVAAKDEMTNTMSDPATYMYQSAGYIETPQALGAGVYVICECVVPSGYVRCAPVAVEIYSDKVSYYKEGSIDSRVLAAIYEDETTDGTTNNKNKPQDTVDVAQVYIEDTPIKLEVSKVKESSVASADTTADKSVTYRVSGRINGKLSEIGGRDDLEYAYLSGKYQGYAWYKGTLEYLAQLKTVYDSDADPLTSVSIIYDGTLFAGYGYVTRGLETADDTNKYVTGATLTLFDAINLRRNDTYDFGKSDYSFSFPVSEAENHGLIIERDLNSNVKRMYVEKGYAGTKTTFLPERDDSGNPVTTTYLTGYAKDGKPIYETGYIWDSETIEREDTDILYYDLDSLQVTVDETVDGVHKHYGYDKNHNKVEISLIEKDKANVAKTDNEHSIYAFRGGIPMLEFVGGDFTKISYSSVNKTITVDKDTLVYHLDTDGNRDCLVDPYTGMAYLIEVCDDGKGGTYEKYMVWPVEVYKDKYGNVISRDKITTSRVGTIGENNKAMMDAATSVTSAADPAGEETAYVAATYEHNESGSVTGSWHDETSASESHTQTSDRTSPSDSNLNGQVLLNDNGGSFSKEYDPVYDKNGNIIYYQRSADTYDKGTDLYDRNDDFVRYDTADNLEEYNSNAYRINDHEELYDADEAAESPATKALYHREGEGYILENTWITGDYSPNDPFSNGATDGQADLIKRIPAGLYIMEEVKVPDGDTCGGYTKAFPVAVTVTEDKTVQTTKMVDRTTKLEIAKVDGTSSYMVNVLAMDNGAADIGDYLDEKTSYSYKNIGGAVLALYKAKKVYTSDYVKYPKGYYLVKEETTPFKYHDTSWTTSNPVIKEAKWTTAEEQPIYLEGIPQGFYILEEISVPSGFIKAGSIEIEIGSDLSVQTILMNEDHTKVEIKKIYFDDYENEKLLRGARLELHEAKVDSSGNVIYDSDGSPTYEETALLSWTTSDETEWANLAPAFKEMFDAHGTDGTSFSYIDAGGSSHTLTRTSIDYAYDIALAGGTSTRYPTVAREIFEDTSGRKVRIAIYEQKTASGKTTYTYDYEYDWISLTAINDYADSYMTAGGIRRFNYLPVGKHYVVIETTVPDGFSKAVPKLISVTETKDIQRYYIEDTQSQIVISKVIEGKTSEYTGAELSLYRAEGETLVQDAAHLVESWISGSDGVYNSTDLLYGRILPGYKVGDLRPHAIKAVPAGTYYLIETKAPGYYKTFEPVKIEYTDISELKFVRASNCPVEGELNITKEDEGGNPLSGAVYRLRTYKSSDRTTAISDVTYTSTGSALKIEHLPVGEEDFLGNIKAYTYVLSEVVPPKGYSTSNATYVWSFDEDKSGKSYSFNETAIESFVFKDKQTSFTFSKKDFDSVASDFSDDVFVEGAVIKLYEMTGIDADGNPVYDELHPIKTITTAKAQQKVEITGLEAGKSYVFIETSAPDPFNKIVSPVAFTVSANGRHIQSLTNKLTALTFIGIEETDYSLDTINRDTDSIMSVVMHGRYVTGVVNEVTDNAGVLIESWPGGTTHVINIGSGYTEGREYTITEKTTYSDGTTIITDKETKNFHFDDNGNLLIESRGIDKVTLGIYRQDGTLVDKIDPVTSDEYEKSIDNSVMPENPVVTMRSLGSEDGDPLSADKTVINTVTFVNPYHVAKDVAITIQVTDDTQYILCPGGTISANTLTYTFSDISAYGSQSFNFYTKVTGDASIMDVSISIGDRTLTSHMETPVIKKNCLTLFNSLTGSGKTVYADETSAFKVRFFYNATGDELAGTYAYTGSKTGSMKSGDEITLAGNEYVIIDTGIFDDVHYEVERLDDGRTVTNKNMTGDFTDKVGGFALSTRSLPDTSIRDIFTDGEIFDAYEKTSFTDGTTIATNRLQFTVGSGNVTAFDLASKVAISKVSIVDGDYVVGADLELYDEGGTLIDSWRSEATPHLIEGKLNPGEKYRLVEKSVTASPGWAYAKDIWFTVDTQGYVVQKVKMTDKPTRVYISKTDITGTTELSECILQITDADNKLIKEWTTTRSVTKVECLLEADKTYTLTEKRPADGFYKAESVTFTVSHDGTIDRVYMKDAETKLEVSKKDITGTDEIPGCHLEIRDNKDRLVTSWISTDTPHMIEGLLTAGETYSLIETKPADGYSYAEKISFTMSSGGEVPDKVTMLDDTTKVEISKKTLTGDDEIPGAHLVIKDTNGTVVEEWTSGTTPHYIEKKLISGETYTLHEDRAADGYAYSEDVTFKVSMDGSIDKVTMRDDTTKAEISKKEITGEDELPGAHLILKDKNGTVVDEWTSTDTPHFIEKKLIAGEVYSLHEEGAPSGFAYSEDVEFTVSKDGSVDKVTMRDEPTKVKISKKDLTGDDEVPGAHLSIKDKSGVVVEEWISTDTPHLIEKKLIAGETYTLHEDKAADGYAYSEDVTFKVSMDGSIDKVTMRDDTTKVKISKKGITGEDEIPGAHLIIKDKNGTAIEDWISADTPHYIEKKLIAGETYTLHEESAPSGFAYSEDVKFTVSKDGTIDKVTMRDKPTKVHLVKKDITDGTDIAGCTFDFIDTETETVAATATTDSSGIDLTGILEAGHTYRVVEKIVPDGYCLAEPVLITISRDGSQDKATVYNIPKPGYEMEKDRPTSAPVKSADKYGFYIGDTAFYDVTIRNTGKMDLEMTVDDAFEETAASYFTVPEVIDVKFFSTSSGAEDSSMGSTLNITGSRAEILIKQGGYAIVTYSAQVLESAKENLSDHAVDDGLGYLNTASTYDVKGKYREYDTGTERTVTKEDYPEDIPDRKDTANTPVQKKSTDPPVPPDPDPEEHYVELQKTTVDNLFVEGARLSLYLGDDSSDGVLISSGYTGKDGKVRLKTKGAGIYYYIETEAPSGYSRDPGRHVITVDSYGNVTNGSRTLIDDYARVAISKVDSVTGEELNGAVFTLYQMDGTPVMTAVSGSNGYAEFTKVLHGKYYIMETDAPEGHTLSPEKRYVNITKFYTNAAPIVWPNQPDFGRLKFKDSGKLRGATGDGSNVMLAVIVLIISATGLVLLKRDKKKKRK